MDNKKTIAKPWVFKTIAVLLPFFAMILLEISLRLCNYGYTTNLFVEDTTGKFYYLNPDISKKYFTVSENATHGNYELFSKEKKHGTFRIFVLGESSTVGFPYLHNGAFPRMLKYRLQFEYPAVNFEIINLSLTAVNSYTLNDFSRQLINYQPDAILIYAGHNEYYGALGVASSSSLGRNPILIRAMIACKKFKTGQLIFRLAAWLKGTDKKTTDFTLTLMERMAHDQSISYNSTLYKQGIHQFDFNMTELLKLYQNHHIPVFLSNLVYNQKDIKPFISTKDKFSADRHYLLGNIAYAGKDYRSARYHYILAKDYDALPFRAPEMINILIKKYTAKGNGIFFVDAMHQFELHSPHGITDSTLLLEHVHPNLKGQRLIADAFYAELKKTRILPVQKNENQSISILRDDYPFTAFDTIFGKISIWLLKEQWPFNVPIPAEDPAHVKSYEEQIAGACAVRQINWIESMQYLSDYYIKKHDAGNAMRIMEGLCLEFPYEKKYFLQAGKLSFMMNNKNKSEFYMNKANQLYQVFH